MKRVLTSDVIKYPGKKIKAQGWVHTIRSHGKIIFADLRDKGGVLQLVFGPQNEALYKLSKKLNRLSYIKQID